MAQHTADTHWASSNRRPALEQKIAKPCAANKLIQHLSQTERS